MTVAGTRCADHVTPLYPPKLALASPTGGGRSVGQDPQGLSSPGIIIFYLHSQ
jgi:hypothetical protein